MTNDKGIFIKNIYYMLSYAFQVLRQKNFEEILSEEFETIQDLFGAILARGVAWQLKQGLYREYVAKWEEVPVARGKIDISGTIKNQLRRKRILSCEYDELSEDNIYNQIVKVTMDVLLRDSLVKAEHKAELKKEILFFHEVSRIHPQNIRWDLLRYQRNNKNYRMLINVCYFVLDGMLMTTDKGTYKMAQFSDEHMHRLYERFVLEYYKRHHTYFTEVKSAQIKWDLSPETDEQMIRFLPAMQTDIFLRLDEKVLIIDTKYYGRILQNRYDKAILHAGNIYQIFTYVRNQDAAGTGDVSGVLLYAKTDEEITPDGSYVMGKNRISIKTLDLNQDFRIIAAQLDRIAEEHFNQFEKIL